ncbi:MAG: preprotein translocase subunit SecA, partial [Candidatus Levybacteria bacterium CG_4_9_14_3_um_filter_36_7]
VKKAGGLLVIGTEKHESRRIDNQLRGRSGRQGDPGRSIFVVSLEDDLMRIFGGEQISNLMTRFNFPEDQPLTHSLVTRVITQAQVKVEGFNFEIRKNLLDYDDVLNKQREILYKTRREIVENDEKVGELVLEKVRNQIARIVSFRLETEDLDTKNEEIIEEFTTILPFDEASKKELLGQVKQFHAPDELIEFLFGLARQVYQKREEMSGKEASDYMAKIVTLSTIDNLWMDHLTAMEDLRTGIGLRGYGQRDP